MSTRLTAGARVTLTIEFQVDDCWGADCTVEQIHRQAKEAAEGQLRKGFIVHGTVLTIRSPPTTSVNVVGKPKVDVIVLEERR